MARRSANDSSGELAYTTLGFTARERQIIDRTMDFLQINKGAAVRMLVRAGAGDPDAEQALARVREATRLEAGDAGPK